MGVPQLTAIILALAWLPIAFFFFRAWQKRRNPISLAICTVLVLLSYGNVLMASVYAGFDLGQARFAWEAIQCIFCSTFYFALWRARRFQSTRRSSSDDRDQD